MMTREERMKSIAFHAVRSYVRSSEDTRQRFYNIVQETDMPPSELLTRCAEELLNAISNKEKPGLIAG